MFSDYKSKFVSPQQAARLAVRSGDWVDYGFGGGFPELMDRALAELTCRFCDNVQHFSRQDLEAMLAGLEKKEEKI